MRFGGILGFDVHLRQPAQPAGQLPVLVAQDVHDRRHEHEADQERIQRHCHGKADANLLEEQLPAERERAEDGDHDVGGAGDDTAEPAHAVVHRTGVVVVGLSFLLDAGEQEDLVVGGQPEHDGEHHHGHREIDGPFGSPVQPFSNTATTTPRAAPIDSRFIPAAVNAG